MSKLHELRKLGHSIWYDYLRRAFLSSGKLRELIDQGLGGIIFNPSVFEKVMAGSADYDERLQNLVKKNQTVEKIYEALLFEDLAQAADLMKPTYDATAGLDGYVSFEVSPGLAHDTAGTIAEAKRLFAALDRPNVMVNVPATQAGITAIAELVGAGINVNATLIYSVESYRAVAEAYLSGLERLANDGRDIDKVTSVASFSVSKLDAIVDRHLEAKGCRELQGRIAIANAKMAFSVFQQFFRGARWEALSEAGARVQRLLWSGTATRNPDYPDTMYMEGLVGPDTLSAVQPATLTAFLDHGIVAAALNQDLPAAKDHLSQLAALEIGLKPITEKLQEAGVDELLKTFSNLMGGIREKRARLQGGKKRYIASLHAFRRAVAASLEEMKDRDIMSRIWAHDHTVWKPAPAEITNRLGWLHSPEVMLEHLPRIEAFVDRVRADGYTQALLLGMGGSSLAPEVFRFVFGVKDGYLDLAVLDSTDPGAVFHYAEKYDPARTLYIVSTKSGGTVETLSFFKYFYNSALHALGPHEVGRHFIAITDPGSSLADIAAQYKFRETFLNDPNIGGRYSALSFFGLIPAGLIGMDLPLLLERASRMALNSEGYNCPVDGDNTGAWLGATMGELALAGRDKITLIASPKLSHFGAWAEQLIAESTGKEGKGIVPVDLEKVGPAKVYANDRLFVFLRLSGHKTLDARVKALIDAGHPVVWLNLNDCYDLGGEFFRWEIATVLAGWKLQINPFDQPDVESAKILARQMVEEYYKKGRLPQDTPKLEADSIEVYTDADVSDLRDALGQLLGQAYTDDGEDKGGSYVALQAYVQPDPDTTLALQKLRHGIRDRFKLATTLGYGPRFLHSTGQLHKGDSGRGLFIQFTSESSHAAPIPDQAGEEDSHLTFGALITAQALGDRQALINAGRKVVRFHFKDDLVDGLRKLIKSV